MGEDAIQYKVVRRDGVHRVLGDRGINVHVSLLAYPVRSVIALVLYRWVPPALKVHNVVRGHEV